MLTGQGAVCGTIFWRSRRVVDHGRRTPMWRAEEWCPEQNRQALKQSLFLLLIADFDYLAAEVYGSVRVALEQRGTPIGPMDTLIAAHTLNLGATLATNNKRESTCASGPKWSTGSEPARTAAVRLVLRVRCSLPPLTIPPFPDILPATSTTIQHGPMVHFQPIAKHVNSPSSLRLGLLASLR
jgi:hypothetical protein